MKVLCRRRQIGWWVPLVTWLASTSGAWAQTHSVPPEPSADSGQSAAKAKKKRKPKSTGESETPARKSKNKKPTRAAQPSEPSSDRASRRPKASSKTALVSPPQSGNQRRSDEPRPRSHPSSTSSAASVPPTSNAAFPGRVLLSLGGHLSLAGKELQKTSEPLGVGPDVTLAFGPRKLPLLFGAQAGFDWFGSTTEHFTYDGMNLDWDLDRRAFWIHALVRFMPDRGVIRPNLDLIGGIWIHDVSIIPDGPFDDYEAQVVGGSQTGSYGVSAGLSWVAESGLLIGLSATYLRGGKITVPNTRDLAVVDDTLHYGETSARGIQQWIFSLQLGGLSR